MKLGRHPKLVPGVFNSKRGLDLLRLSSPPNDLRLIVM
jgi:hypothetical protein